MTDKQIIGIVSVVGAVVLIGGVLFVLRPASPPTAPFPNTSEAAPSGKTNRKSVAQRTIEPATLPTLPRSPDDATGRELARLRAENDRLKALATNVSGKPLPVPVPSVATNGKVTGSAWTVKNDGTSNLLRGLPVAIVEKESTDVDKVIAVLKTQKKAWDGWADYSTKQAEDIFQKIGVKKAQANTAGEAMRSFADGYASDATTAAAKGMEIQVTIDKLSAVTSIDRLQALELEKHALELEKPLSDGRRTWTEARDLTPQILAGGGPRGITLGSSKTNVEGKFVIDNIPSGDYYLISVFRSSTLIIDWTVPVHVNGDKETVVDLDNDNAAYIFQKR